MKHTAATAARFLQVARPPPSSTITTDECEAVIAHHFVVIKTSIGDVPEGYFALSERQNEIQQKNGCHITPVKQSSDVILPE